MRLRTQQLEEANLRLEEEIAQRRVVEQRLRKYQRLWERAERAAHVGSWYSDLRDEGRLFWSPEVYRIFGIREDEFDNRIDSFLDLVHPEDRESVRRASQDAIAGVRPYRIEHRVVLPDGTQRHVAEEAEVLFDEQGQPLEMIGMCWDVTSRRHAEWVLKTFFELSLDLFCVADASGRFTHVNPAFERVLGHSAQELTARPFFDFVHPDDLEQTRREMLRIIAGEPVLDFSNRYRCKDGSYRVLSWRATPLRDGRTYATARDITERHRLEENRFIRKVAEALPHFMYVYDLRAQRLDFINRPTSLDLGYSAQESRRLEQSPFEMFHPDDVVKIPQWQARWRQARDGEIYSAEFRMRDACGHYRWFQSHETVFSRADDGSVHQVLGITQEITAAKLADDKIREALHEKEVLLREVHHRVKNNLQIVSSLVNLQASHIDDPAARQLFDETRHRIRTMALLHETLYQTENFAKVDFPRYVHNLVRYLVRSYGVDTQRVALEIDVAEVNFGLDHAIPCGLIVSELVTNALKYAFPDQRRGTLAIRLAPLDDDHFRLTVKDDGVGAAASCGLAQPRTLGLQLVHDLVQQLRGVLTIAPGPGFEASIVFFV